VNGIKKPIIIGSDHGGYSLKEDVKEYITRRGISLEDVGCYGEDSVDYPDYGIRVASGVANGKFERGILLCGSGLGMSMVANRFPHVRAALCNDLFSAALSRQHNNANILVLGGRVIGKALGVEIVKTWLDTPFEGGRHQARIDKFDKIE